MFNTMDVSNCADVMETAKQTNRAFNNCTYG